MAASIKQRIIVYVDGFNFYYGIRQSKQKKHYWLDMVQYFESFIRPHQELIKLKYFSATPSDQGKYDRQDLFFTANKLNPKFALYLGKYMPKNRKCKKCGEIHKTFEEKETDVKIATNMIADVVNDRCDISILVSADSDLIPPIDFIKEYKPTHKILVYFPPHRFSNDLESLATATKKLQGTTNILDACMLPENITLPNGYVISRPTKWR